MVTARIDKNAIPALQTTRQFPNKKQEEAYGYDGAFDIHATANRNQYKEPSES